MLALAVGADACFRHRSQQDLILTFAQCTAGTIHAFAYIIDTADGVLSGSRSDALDFIQPTLRQLRESHGAPILAAPPASLPAELSIVRRAHLHKMALGRAEQRLTAACEASGRPS